MTITPQTKTYLGLTIDLAKDSRFSEQARTLLDEFYLKQGETSPQEAYARAAVAYCAGDLALAQRVYNYASDGWFMFSSPILSNAPLPNEKHKGLPISCFLSLISDNLESIIAHQTEVAWLSVNGGGVGGHWSDVRAVSKKAPGPMPFMKVVDSEMTAFKQGSTRKGSYAAYLDIGHPDIEEFMTARVATGGDPNRKLFNTHLAVNITDDFMQAVVNDLEWNFKCPASGEVRGETCKARDLWHRILETRFKTGEPYLCFIDTANKALPKALKDMGLKINGSNLCVAPETYILTKELGNVPISHLEDEEVSVWNGEEWSITTVRKTGVGKELLKVMFSDGSLIECTPEHGFYIQEGYNKNKINKVMAKDLTVGSKLEKWGMPNVPKPIMRDVTVVGVVNEGRISDTYCFTEPKRNRGMFNGIVTANCNEIYLPTSEDRTAVCCLSSANLAYFDEWSKTSMVRDLITYLDNVLQAFIDNCPDEMSKARFSAMSERSLGLGAMGFHTYLQQNGIPFCSALAVQTNLTMFKHIKSEADKATITLYGKRGPAMDLSCTGRRNAHLLAVAPNANSSIICMTSSSIEPIKSNAYMHRTRAGSHLVKNPQLESLLEQKGFNTEEVWSSIVLNKGSVQHLECLDDWEKMVYQTAFEIDQRWVVKLAGDRQAFICQGQSVNLFFPYGSDRNYVEEVHYMAWRHGLKGLYYLRTEAQPATVATVKTERIALKDGDDTCIACQG